ncbi:dihydrolipoyl dehydrogenase [Agrobacterium rhizogenes]|uniref:dihydrolipoyl dehydrogenase n=1 Tax=Rhizobium rhizogenes TaxID=359 RepID=UPI001571F837|nr:dihydrolipoyl dehydrogenase [Rhizobium rhizogenes]NTG51727.1 dihydrolipoyl dehydrogenase [Rhizobium rhizogenes]
MKLERTKVLIVGAGPGGYVCAIRCGQMGLDTVVVEAKALGGTCLNVGCIPSKALIHAANEFHKICDAPAGPLGISTSGANIDLLRTVAWKDGIIRKLTDGVGGLLKKANVRTIQGHASIIDGKTVEIATEAEVLRITCENLVIATGSRSSELPNLPFGGRVISSTQALELTERPEHLVIVGGGYIGLEIGTAFAKLGSKVTIIEAEDRILPRYDAELSKPVAARLSKLGVAVHTNGTAKRQSEDGLIIETANGERNIPCDKILVVVGRQPVLDTPGLEALGLDMQERYLKIDSKCETSMRGVYAVGDVTGEPMLAHRAMAQGQLVAGLLAGQNASWDKRSIPAVCFTDPEVVSVGLSPQSAPGAKVSIFPLSGNGRSMTLERSDGFVRFVTNVENELVLGIQAVGAGISELAGQFSLAIEMGATLTDIAATIHAHPTLGESLQEAALKGLGQALHA